PRPPRRHASSSVVPVATGTASQSNAIGPTVSSAGTASISISAKTRSTAIARPGLRRSAIEVTGEGKHRQQARPLDRGRELLLVTGARARNAARYDLAAIGHETAEALLVL